LFLSFPLFLLFPLEFRQLFGQSRNRREEEITRPFKNLIFACFLLCSFYVPPGWKGVRVHGFSTSRGHLFSFPREKVSEPRCEDA
jgi:hypothetical protein